MTYFDLKLSNKLNFGSDPILQGCAAKCDAILKDKLAAWSLELQRDVQVAREEANNEAIKQLKTCGERFMIFGRDEWVRQCRVAGSSVNILDQLYSVRCGPLEAPGSQEVVSDSDQEEETTSAAPSYTEKMSTFLYYAAIHDSKKKLDELVRARRADVLREQDRKKALKEKMNDVDVSASAVRPTDVSRLLSKRFEAYDKRLETHNKRIGTLEQSSVNTAAESSFSARAPETGSSSHLMERVEQLEQQLETMQREKESTANANARFPKNGPRADAAEMQASEMVIKKARIALKAAEEAAASAQRTTHVAPIQRRDKDQNPNTRQHGSSKGFVRRDSGRGGGNAGKQVAPHTTRQIFAERGRQGRGRARGPGRA